MCPLIFGSIWYHFTTYVSSGVVTKQQHSFCAKRGQSSKLSELRPVKRHLTFVKRKSKRTKEVSQNIKNFKSRWADSSKKVAEATIKSLMEELPKKVYKVLSSGQKYKIYIFLRSVV